MLIFYFMTAKGRFVGVIGEGRDLREDCQDYSPLSRGSVRFLPV